MSVILTVKLIIKSNMFSYEFNGLFSKESVHVPGGGLPIADHVVKVKLISV